MIVRRIARIRCFPERAYTVSLGAALLQEASVPKTDGVEE
jgi:hypothetical protein